MRAERYSLKERERMEKTNNPTILLVDDDQGLRKAILFDLNRKGYHVIEAENGEMGFDLIKKNENNSIDLVISDVKMPVCDGITFLDKVKKNNLIKPLVILMTGYADITLEEALDFGADEVVIKPFERKAFLNMISKTLTNQNEKWKQPSSNSTSASFLKIDLTFLNFEQSISEKRFNLGRGGFFINHNYELSNKNTLISFHITFEKGSLNLLEGEGLVRWSRNKNEKHLPIGCGVEFIYLNNNCREQIIDYLKVHQLKPFIPLS